MCTVLFGLIVEKNVYCMGEPSRNGSVFVLPEELELKLEVQLGKMDELSICVDLIVYKGQVNK